MLALLLAAVLAAAPSPAAPAAPATVSEQVIGGQFATVVTPRPRTNRVVIVAHGAGRTGSSMLASIPTLVDALVERGFTVAATDAHYNAWGNRASRRDYVTLAETMRRRGRDRVFVLARSMGGLATLGALSRIRPVAWAGIYPACNIGSLGRYAAGIERAWDTPFWVLRGRRSLNPIRARGVGGMPMLFWASPQDTVVSKALNTDRCAADAARRGADVTVVETRGDHGDPSNLQPGRLAAFFVSADRRTRSTRAR